MTDWNAVKKRRTEGKVAGWDQSGRVLIQDESAFSESPASAVTATRASTIESPEKRIEFYASQRFPDMPLEEAKKRYGVLGGDIVYVDENNRLQKEVAGVAAGTADFMGRNALPIGGAVIGALLGGPLGAGVGGMGGLGYRKAAGQLQGDEQTAMGNVKDLALEGAIDFVGGKVGEKFATGAVNRRVVKDAGKIDYQKTKDIIKMGKDMGISVTPAEASGLASLINQQTRYGMGMDDAGDILRAFYEKRAAQEGAAIEGFIGKTPQADVAGGAARDVAKQSIDDAKAARSTASGPLYKTGVRDDVLIPEKQAQEFLSDDIIRGAANKAKENPNWGVIDSPENSVRFLDAVKKVMDDEAKTLRRQGADQQAALIEQKAKYLRNQIDELYPVYRQARGAHAGQSGEVEALERGVEGVLANVKDPGLRKMAERLFNPAQTGPYDIGKIRNLFSSQGKKDEWDGLLNVYLRDSWERLRLTKGGGDLAKAGDWRKAVFGSTRARDNMKAAMGEERFRDFTNLMDVLEATSKVPKSQSMTQPAAEAAKREQFEAAPIIEGSRGFGVGGLREYWVNARVDAWREDIAKVITNQDSLDTLAQLRQLKSLNPRSEKAIEAVSVALLQAGVLTSRAVLSTGPSQRPPTVDR